MKKKSLMLMGHATSISMEDEFWDALKELAQEKNTSIRQLITQIDMKRTTNLSSAVRVYILAEIQKKLIPVFLQKEKQ